MKSLKEALLNRPKNVDVSQVAVAEYINTNYTTRGRLTYKATNGIYIVNCGGDVKVENKEIEKLTDGFVWGKVRGSFDCGFCPNLKSLEGSPKEVGEDVYYSFCGSLESLEGGPEKVKGSFDCSCCRNLKSLEGAPGEVGGDFNCSYCPGFKTLKGAPERVGGDFNCYSCKGLESLEGAPKEVGGDFNCVDCKNLKQ